MIISRHEIARSKVNKIVNGYSAFTETKEIADLVKKELASLNVEVYEDVTDIGSWFFPVKKEA